MRRNYTTILFQMKTHSGRVTQISVSKLTINGSDNALSPGRRQAVIWTTAGILLIGPLRTNFREILIEIYTFKFKKMHLKISSGKWQPFWFVGNVINHRTQYDLVGASGIFVMIGSDNCLSSVWHQAITLIHPYSMSSGFLGTRSMKFW